jgi:uncharacterized protein (DUF952 family)
MAKVPDCKWAQRKDKLFLTINVANLDKDVSMPNPHRHFPHVCFSSFLAEIRHCRGFSRGADVRHRAARFASRRRPSM